MLEAVDAAGFQYKNGAAFIRGDEYSDFDSATGSRRGGTRRTRSSAPVRQAAGGEAQKQGVEIRYEVRVTASM